MGQVGGPDTLLPGTLFGHEWRKVGLSQLEDRAQERAFTWPQPSFLMQDLFSTTRSSSETLISAHCLCLFFFFLLQDPSPWREEEAKARDQLIVLLSMLILLSP